METKELTIGFILLYAWDPAEKFKLFLLMREIALGLRT